MHLTFFIASILLLISGCASDVTPRIKNAESLASVNNFEKKLVKGEDFVITTFQRVSNNQQPYVFYLEGDGRITERGGSISDNPTPAIPTALKLATLDTRPNVIYVARPCQYTPIELNPRCNQAYWTDKRMHNEVVSAINDVINKVNNGQPFSLVGFSGGGGIAVLVAARNKNVRDIITVAGNLDHISFSEYHKTLRIADSLNPIDYAEQVNHIPQLHLAGKQDTRVPSSIAKQYVKVSHSECVRFQIVPNVTHNEGWDAIWGNILQSLM